MASITDEFLLQLGFWLLGVTLLGLVTSLILGLREAFLSVNRWAERQQLVIHDYEVAIVEHQLHEALFELQIASLMPPLKPKSHRYNIHCPSCGRFAKRVLNQDNVVECSQHGVMVRWSDIPINWNLVPIAPGVSFSTEPLVSELGLIPITQPIDIIVPDDLSSFYEEVGASI